MLASENAADLVDATGAGPVAGRGEGEERRRGREGDGAADVGDSVGRGLRDVCRRVLPPRREGHQPGLLRRLGGELARSLLLCFFSSIHCLILCSRDKKWTWLLYSFLTTEEIKQFPALAYLLKYGSFSQLLT